MRKLLLLLLLAIFGLGAVSVLLIQLTGSSPGLSSLPSLASTPPAESPVTPLPASGPAPAAQEATAQSWVPPPAPVQQLLPPPPRGSWYATPIVSRAAAMGRLGGAISQGLADLQPRVSACFDELTQARHGQQAYTTVDYAAAEESGSTVLLLQIEALRDEVLIAGAAVETRGGASDGLLACAQSALRNRKVSAPGAVPGQNFRLRYTLAP